MLSATDRGGWRMIHIDAAIYDNPKFLALGPVTDPRSMWLYCLAWTIRNRKINEADGFVPRPLPARFAESKARGDRIAAQLVDAELWTPSGTGWLVCGWITHTEPERPPRHRAEIVATLARRDGGHCRGCGHAPDDATDLEVDHVMPRALGGPHVMSNLQLLCGPCNRRKSAKHPIRWEREIRR